MDQYDKKLEEYKQHLIEQAEDLVFQTFPATMLKLNTVLENRLIFDKPYGDIHEELGICVPDPILIRTCADVSPAKRTKFSITNDAALAILGSPSIPSNRHVINLIDIIKPHVKKLLEDVNLLKMWILFMIPKAENGNDFGIAIQETALGEIQTVEADAAAFFDLVSAYFSGRGKLITKTVKYPYVEDFRLAVREFDEREYHALVVTLTEIRNRYGLLHDIITKNIEKIKNPRPIVAIESLY